MQFLLGFGPFLSHQVCFSLSLSLSLSRRICSSGGRAQPHHVLPEGLARQGDAIISLKYLRVECPIGACAGCTCKDSSASIVSAPGHTHAHTAIENNGLCLFCIKACTRPFAIAKLQHFCRRGRPTGLHLKMFPVVCVHVSKTLPSGCVIQVNHALAAGHKTRNTMTAMIVYKGFG